LTGIADRELLVRIDERVGAIQIDIGRLNEKLEDHHNRIGKLENWKFYVLGAASAFGAAAAIIVALITRSMGG